MISIVLAFAYFYIVLLVEKLTTNQQLDPNAKHKQAQQLYAQEEEQGGGGGWIQTH
jgi:hypothetical protein